MTVISPEWTTLRVTFSADLTWGKHITAISHKTRKLIRIFFRKFCKFSNHNTSLKLYKSLICPHLEYASAVWSSHLAKDIKMIEDVQKFALRVCTKNWNTNHELLLLECSLDSIAVCRTFSTYMSPDI